MIDSKFVIVHKCQIAQKRDVIKSSIDVSFIDIDVLEKSAQIFWTFFKLRERSKILGYSMNSNGKNLGVSYAQNNSRRT